LIAGIEAGLSGAVDLFLTAYQLADWAYLKSFALSPAPWSDCTFFGGKIRCVLAHDIKLCPRIDRRQWPRHSQRPAYGHKLRTHFWW